MDETAINDRLEVVCLRITELNEQLAKSPLAAPPKLKEALDALSREMRDLIRIRRCLRAC